MRRGLLVAALVAVAVAAGLSLRAHGAAAPAKLTVYAAASLTDAFPALDRGESYSFGGSNDLAAQIEQGAPADVFASANAALPAELYAKGLCSKPAVFTRNELIVIVPKANPAGIHSIDDLTKPGVRVVIAGAGVPVGDYTMTVLDKLDLATAVLKNVVGRESDVRGVLSKVALGEADAGFVYTTDAKSALRHLDEIAVPARAEPDVEYGICVVSSSREQSAARAFVQHVLGNAGQRTLRRYGFLPR
jgi:molybdate transport system substrate-binding protein